VNLYGGKKESRINAAGLARLSSQGTEPYVGRRRTFKVCGYRNQPRRGQTISLQATGRILLLLGAPRVRGKAKTLIRGSRNLN